MDIVRVVLGLVVLLFLLYVPGAATLNALAASRRNFHPFAGLDEWLFSAVLVSFLLTGLLGLVLAEVGFFRWWLLLLLVAVVSVVIGLLLAQIQLRTASLLALVRLPGSYPQRVTDRRVTRFQQLALVILLVLAAALFSRPAEMLRGALDSGVYIDGGIAIGRTGAIFQHDQLMRELNDDTGEGSELLTGLNPTRYTLDRLRMPGFYVYDKKAALVAPQHYSLYPVWVGLMYSLFGIWGALYTTPLLMLLAVLAVYYFARRILNPSAALLALALLIICPVTVWFARYPVSEVITCLLAFAAFYAFARMMQLLREREAPPFDPHSDPQAGLARSEAITWSSFWGVIAGASLGELALARPDFIFYFAPVPIYLLYWRLSRRWQTPHTFFAASLAITMGIYLAHLSIYSYPYTFDLYFNTIINLRREWRPLLIALYGGVLILVLLDRLYSRLQPLWLRLAKAVRRYRWVWAGVIVLAIAAYVVYTYGIAPWQYNARLDRAGRPIAQAIKTTWESYIGAPVDQGGRYNLLRVGWYLSPLGVIVGFAGLLRWAWSRLGAATWLFFGALLTTGFVFLQETYTDPHYIYTMRRYVPLILPALILGFAWACHFLWTRIKPRLAGATIAALLAVALSVFFIYTQRVLLPHVEEKGAVAELTALSQKLNTGQNTVVLFSQSRDEPYVVATPLQYVFGIESFVLFHDYPNVDNKVLQGIVERWQKQGYKVWVLMSANGGKLHFPDLTLKEEGSWAYDVPELEQLLTQKPSNVSRSYLPWGIYSVQPASPPPARPFHVDIGNMDYQWLVGGFYTQERDNDNSPYWRWTGDHAVVRVPWPASSDGKTLQGGQITLRLRPETPVPGKPVRRTQPITITLTLDNSPIGTVTIPPGSGFTDYTVTVPAGLQRNEEDSGYALVHIHAPTWSPAQAGVSGDTRALGVQVGAIDVK